MFLDSFKTVFDIISSGNTELWCIVWTSITVSFSATIIAALIGITSGFFLAIHHFNYKQVVVTILNTLLSIPTVVVGLFLYGFLSRRGLFGNLGILYTNTAMIIGQTILIFPIVTTFVYSAVKAVDPKIAKTAKALGASVLQTAVVIAKEARYGIALAVIAAFGRAISEVGVSMMLGGNISGFTRNITTAIALEHNKGNFALALALGLILLIITFTINAVFRYMQGLNKP